MTLYIGTGGCLYILVHTYSAFTVCMKSVPDVCVGATDVGGAISGQSDVTSLS